MKPRRVKINGLTITVADDEGAFWRRVEEGRWEPGTLAFIDCFGGPDIVFLDCGAWVGATSLYAAARGRDRLPARDVRRRAVRTGSRDAGAATARGRCW